MFALGLLWLAWDSEAGRRWRSSWQTWDWVGFAILLVGVAVGFSALMGHLSTSWRETTGFFKDRVFDHGVWALGALSIGIGILPALLGIAALARPKNEPRSPETSAFVVTSVAALAAFVWYAGIKGAYLQNVFSTVVVERNVIYLAPILFASAAMAVARGVGRGWAIAAAGVLTVFIVASTPLHLGQYPFYEAHGLSIAAFANRKLGWSEGTIEGVLIAACVVALVVVVALKLLRPRSVGFAAVAASAAVVVVAWSLTGQVYAAAGERHFSELFDRGLPHPYTLGRRSDRRGVRRRHRAADHRPHEHPADGVLQSVDAEDVVASTERRSRSAAPILTPDLNAVDGTLSPSPGTKYALAVNGVRLQAPIVARRKNAVLYRIDGKPLKLQEALVGRQTDGWMVGTSEDPVARASYTRYDVSADNPGLAFVQLTRIGWCPKPGAPSDRQGDRAHRPGGHRPRQAAADRAGHGDTALRRSGLQGERRHPHASQRPRGGWRSRSRRRSCRRRSIRRAARPADSAR